VQGVTRKGAACTWTVWLSAGACPVTQHLQTALRSVEKRGSVKARRAIPESFLKRRDRVALTGPVIVRGDPETGAGLAGSWVRSPTVRCYGCLYSLICEYAA
jgi:hypothetical protein